MTIEVQQPRLQALIQQRMASGQFQTVEDAFVQALESAPLPRSLHQDPTSRTGTELIATMQVIPYKDIELEHSHLPHPVRDVEF